MDSLPEDEIEAIWQRQKQYINLNEINGNNKSQVQEQIRKLMESAYVPETTRNGMPMPEQAKPTFLIRKGFVERVVNNAHIYAQILDYQIQSVRVKGKERFKIKKGVPSFTSKAGKKVTAGQFLKGKTKEEAINNFVEKTEE